LHRRRPGPRLIKQVAGEAHFSGERRMFRAKRGLEEGKKKASDKRGKRGSEQASEKTHPGDGMVPESFRGEKGGLVISRKKPGLDDGGGALPGPGSD